MGPTTITAEEIRLEDLISRLEFLPLVISASEDVLMSPFSFVRVAYIMYDNVYKRDSRSNPNPPSSAKIRQLVLQDSFRNPRGRKRYIRPDTRPIRQDSPKNRELLGAFWDKLSLDEAMEIASLKNATLEVMSLSNISHLYVILFHLISLPFKL
ncbi:uncharacterized protein LOC131254887 [Magnolia sinica]|uniref:uncharacterized protein LOC131254887 n=1 Tax=Magnolia sinica TaxID=86752 RepID=UPI00265A73EF|nr:uncharacterized protein LOC131254887 [Magnolia sinica]